MKRWMFLALILAASLAVVTVVVVEVRLRSTVVPSSAPVSVQTPAQLPPNTSNQTPASNTAPSTGSGSSDSGSSTTPSASTTSSTDPFTFKQTVTVSPDGTYSSSSFCRINALPDGSGNLFVTFQNGGNAITQPTGTQGYAYKEYSPELTYLNKTGLFHHGGGDTSSVMAGNDYFFLSGGPNGFQLEKYDPISWTLVGHTTISIDATKQNTNDMMLAYANGQLDVSDLYIADHVGTMVDQKTTDPTKGYATFHDFYTTDLQPITSRILTDVPHINGTSLLYVNGAYQFITSTAFFGNLIVLQYDSNWRYLGMKTLAKNGQWAQGAAWDEARQMYYVTYVKTPDQTVKGGPSGGIRVAAFDKDWNPVSDDAVVNATGSQLAGRPSLLLDKDTLYVSYDVSTSDPQTHEENKDWNCDVSEYSLAATK